MIIAGVTGGIGSGKTTLCRQWEKLGARVIYADDLAKELMETDPHVRQKLIDLFGSETYNPDGSLNKPHLINAAFKEGRTDELNGVVHPAVAKAFKEECERAADEGIEMIVEEAALLLNKGRPNIFDTVVIVVGDEEERIRRVANRDSTNREDVEARVNKQPDFKKLLGLADYVIVNDGTLEEFKKKSTDLFHTIIEDGKN
ncbi:MAG: dephospho-CoA kinase [Balneolaceae bacterium]|nr:dephospho-CoA kinase [Balneolaceae bacterium]MCH8547814.1 dephospho-CoA kinase [Balneolaceae bacterium]